MLRANQKQVANNANISLTNLRSYELNYFLIYFTAFGTQTAIVLNNIISAYSGIFYAVRGSHASSGDDIIPLTVTYYRWTNLYFVISTISWISAVHSLLCSIYVSVYGQGLAIRGDVGSMVRALNGMIISQQNVLISFVISVFTFMICSIGMYFIPYNRKAATISGSIILAGIVVTYSFCLRIYNRFKFQQIDPNDRMEFNDAKENKRRIDDDDDGIPLELKQKYLSNDISKESNDSLEIDVRSVSTASRASSSSPKKLKLPHKLFSSKFSRRSSNESKKEVNITVLPWIDTSIVYEGYLCTDMQPDRKSSSFFTSKPKSLKFVERYLVLRSDNCLYCYSSHDSFKNKPYELFNRIPVDLRGLHLEVPNIKRPPFKLLFKQEVIDFQNIKKPIEFQCNSMQEASRWIDAFNSL